MVRIGVIGLGMMGRTHIEAYEKIDGAQVVAIADIDPKRAAGDLSGVWSNIDTSDKQMLPMDRIKGTTDPRKMIRMAEVDLVDVCVPTPDHAKLTIAALKADKHVICEKPLARTIRQAQQIADTAEGAKGFFMPAMCIRFWPAYAWLKKAVDEGVYGAVKSVVLRRLGSPPPNWFRDGAQSGGAIWDLHIHDADFVYYLLGKPKSVSSQGYAAVTGEIDHVLTQYAYEQAPLVVAEGGWSFQGGFPFQMSYMVNFERATATFDSQDGKVMVSRDGKAQAVEVEAGMGYDKELQYLVKCVASGQAPTLVTAQDAVESLKIVEAERKSIQRGRPVKL